MIVVVEVASRSGDRASKEYDVPTIDEAMNAVERELKRYPALRVIDVDHCDRTTATVRNEEFLTARR